MDSLWVDFGGIDQPGGWFTINIDGVIDPAPNLVADFTASANQLGAYFAPQSISRAQCIHTLEHIPFPEVLPTLRYWRTFMQPGAPLLIVVPDMDRISRDFVAGVIPFEMFIALTYANPARHATHGLPMLHKWGYNRNSLTELLLKAGYTAPYLANKFPTNWHYDYAYPDNQVTYFVPNLIMEARA